MQKLILRTNLCPGDTCTLTAAVESLHLTYPGEYTTDVRTPTSAIWEHNPRITSIPDCQADRMIDMHYPSIGRCNQESSPFLAGYTAYLGEQLGRPLPLRVNRPWLYLSEEERQWKDHVAHHFTGGRKVPFWVVNAGIKSDFTCKAWPLEHYQAVVDATVGRIQWVQVGSIESKHEHPSLRGVIDVRGQTDHRQLIRLVYHAAGGLGPVTYLQHLCAAFEHPYICLVGGREPPTWCTYPWQHTLSSVGALDCCRRKACWKSRVMPLGDGDPKDTVLCEQPVLGLSRPVPKCMAMIQPSEVLAILQRITPHG